MEPKDPKKLSITRPFGEYTKNGKPTGKCVLDDVDGEADDAWREKAKEILESQREKEG